LPVSNNITGTTNVVQDNALGLDRLSFSHTCQRLYKIILCTGFVCFSVLLCMKLQPFVNMGMRPAWVKHAHWLV